ncbi:Pentatricopeptide repeat superfamily protein [Prunus dulcis]|uniref:Pentatricopeptide repeat superfamily protein n=1 Tax=Prunus dulcis TaxID=3755 RepID=A0A5H2XSC7_PRUDU|nr:Pentatricopeptide repeat superfamily protein [Prunus dulcis]
MGYSKWFEDWARPSNGFVQGVQFLDVVMINVQNPIVIDQNYCPHNINCPAQRTYLMRAGVLRVLSRSCSTRIAACYGLDEFRSYLLKEDGSRWFKHVF